MVVIDFYLLVCVTCVRFVAADVTASSPAPSLQLSADLTLRSTLSDDATISGNAIEIVVSAKKNTWIALGFPKSNTVSMTGDGHGAELYVCAQGGSVERYWVTQYHLPDTGKEVLGSSCAHSSGETTMTLRRQLQAQGSDSVAITPEEGQIVIYGHGTDGETLVSKHLASDRGGKLINWQSLSPLPEFSIAAGIACSIHGVDGCSADPKCKVMVRNGKSVCWSGASVGMNKSSEPEPEPEPRRKNLTSVDANETQGLSGEASGEARRMMASHASAMFLVYFFVAVSL